jgi:hypothetical protein
MTFKNLVIEYVDPDNHHDVVVAEFVLADNPVAQKWAQKVALAQQQYPIDDPGRFYGFGSRESQAADAIARINHCCTIINRHLPIVARELTTVHDQDTLNYLHHIFELYHGLLDTQHHNPYWQSAPAAVRCALADLNVLVHRCESVARGAAPRHVITYYGLPKTDQLELSDYEYFTNAYQYGTAYLNYVEIGKTLEDLAYDDDHYIEDDAFRPFRHYSADFNIKFYDTTASQLAAAESVIDSYYCVNQEFFNKRQLLRDHPYLRAGSVPVAHLRSGNSLDQFEAHQWVKSVKLF